MADDIVTRLRSENRMALAPFHMTDAADEIERLRSMIEALTRNSLTHLSVELPEEARRG